MRRLDHWNPHYVATRLAVMWDERRHPDHPWLTKEAVGLLDRMLRTDDVGLEFGSGRSTKWLLDRISTLVSVEANEDWFNRVKADNATSIEAGRLDYRRSADADDYARIIGEFDDVSLGFCLVDGIHRDICAINILPKLKPGALLVIDNINRYIPCDLSRAPDTRRAGQGGATPLWDNFLKATPEYRYIWTTNGVSDTGIWIKP